MEDFEFLGKYNGIVTTYHEESDRAAAILAAAFLDEVLGECLLYILVEDPSVKELFNGYGPLSSFSARIGMAYGLGLLAPEMKSDLNLIRKIRNHFAHHSSHTSFATPLVKDWCQKLSTAYLTKDEGAHPVGAPYPVDEAKSPKLQYLYAVAFTVFRLDAVMKEQSKREVPHVRAK